jgi:chromosome segregation ATPase
MGSELASARAQSAEDSKRRTALERDITLLKESIEATQVAAEASARTLVEHDQAASLLKEKLAAASAQVAVWETAIKTRDARIRSLNEDLAAARQRLDQAIAKLKAAGQSNKQ